MIPHQREGMCVSRWLPVLLPGFCSRMRVQELIKDLSRKQVFPQEADKKDNTPPYNWSWGFNNFGEILAHWTHQPRQFCWPCVDSWCSYRTFGWHLRRCILPYLDTTSTNHIQSRPYNFKIVVLKRAPPQMRKFNPTHFLVILLVRIYTLLLEIRMFSKNFYNITSSDSSPTFLYPLLSLLYRLLFLWEMCMCQGFCHWPPSHSTSSLSRRSSLRSMTLVITVTLFQVCDSNLGVPPPGRNVHHPITNWNILHEYPIKLNMDRKKLVFPVDLLLFSIHLTICYSFLVSNLKVTAQPGNLWVFWDFSLPLHFCFW